MTQKQRISTSILALAISLTASVTLAAPVLLFEDDFSGESPVLNTGGPGYDIYDEELTNWTVDQGNVDAVAPGAFGCPNDPCIDLDGSFLSVPAILTTKDSFVFESGHEYNFQMEIPTINSASAGSDDDFTVSIGTLFSYSAPSSYLSLLIDENFVAGSNVSEQIKIEMFGPVDNFGPYLTYISLSKIDDDNGGDPGVIPLPGALPLLLSGLAGTAILSRRRKPNREKI